MSEPAKAESRTHSWPLVRIAGWAVTAAVVAIVAGPTYLRAFLPPRGAYTDFVQEWLSARNYFAGTPIYQDVPTSLAAVMTERTGADGPPPSIAFTDPQTGATISEMKYNAHPPVAVLLALPFGRLSYPHAHLAWNLVSYGLLVAAAACVVRELRIPFPWPAIFPAIILLLGNPVLNQIYQGQLNCVLAALVTAAWAADRRGRPGLAGVAIGLAGAIKLYPLFLLAYFAFGRRWTGLAAGVATFLAANGLAAAVFGPNAFRDYASEVVPTVAGQFQAAWDNLSLSAFWLRLAGPQLGRPLGLMMSAIVVALVAGSSWRAQTSDSRDRAFSLAVVGMLLVSPLTWSHYALLLLVPLGVAWTRVSGPRLWVFGAVLAILWLPPNFAAQMWFGRENATGLNGRSTFENLALVAVPHYALLALFVLVYSLRSRA